MATDILANVTPLRQVQKKRPKIDAERARHGAVTPHTSIGRLDHGRLRARRYRHRYYAGSVGATDVAGTQAGSERFNVV